MAARARAKSPNATERRGKRQDVASINWPEDENGPQIQISVSASELIPTGDYANVVVGPVTATKFVSDDGELSKHLNELAEVIESECIAEQRELVLSTLQAAVQANKK